MSAIISSTLRLPHLPAPICGNIHTMSLRPGKMDGLIYIAHDNVVLLNFTEIPPITAIHRVFHSPKHVLGISTLTLEHTKAIAIACEDGQVYFYDLHSHTMIGQIDAQGTPPSPLFPPLPQHPSHHMLSTHPSHSLHLSCYGHGV